MNISRQELIENAELLSRLMAALESLGTVSDSDGRSRLLANVYLALAQSYLAELAKHLADGLNFDEALIATIRGELKLSTEQVRLLEDAQRRMSDPTRHN